MQQKSPLFPACATPPMARAGGFTLLEVLAALAIIAIGVSLVVPWYGDYSRRSNIAEGMLLAAPATAHAAELVTIGQLTRSGLPSSGHTMGTSPWTENNAATPTDWEVLALNPSKSVENIIRGGSVVIVTYTTKVDPNNTTRYSLILYGTLVANSGVNWECLTGGAYADILTAAQQQAQPVGAPLPPELAPPGCKTSAVSSTPTNPSLPPSTPPSASAS